jgi:serine/threonine protein phosphatase PrpC
VRLYGRGKDRNRPEPNSLYVEVLPLRLDVGANSDVGRARETNEDAYRMEPALDLYALSDGMGGAAHGEVASALAIETLVAHCLEAENNRAAPLFVEPRPGFSEHLNRLESAVTLANRKIFDSAAANPELAGMGATVVAAWIKGSRLSVAHVGDSRAYLLRAGVLEQLTDDHSLAAEHVRRGLLTPQQAETSQLQSVLVRALGTAEHVDSDVKELDLLDGDTLLLCSDGLTRMVTEPEIASTLMTVEPAQAAADHLVELANDYGGADNVTAIVVHVTEVAGGVFARLKRWSRHSSSGS